MAEAIIGSYNPATGERKQSTWQYQPVQPPSPGLMTPQRANALLNYTAQTDPKSVPALYRRLEATMEYQRRVAAGQKPNEAMTPDLAQGIFGSQSASMYREINRRQPKLEFTPVPGMTNRQIATYGNTMRDIENKVVVPGTVTKTEVGGVPGVEIRNPSGTVSWKPLQQPTESVVERYKVTPAVTGKPGFFNIGKVEARPETSVLEGKTVTRKVPIGAPSATQPRASFPSKIPQSAIEHLKKNPSLKAAFDEKYGQGSADLYLR